MTEFNYDSSKLEIDFYGDSKVDVFDDDELVLEINKIDDSLWLVQASWIEDNLILIKQDLANELIRFIGREIKEKHGTELPVVLHPNFFLPINNLNSN
ncbi:hypothetical protein [Spongiimicrobium sp. 2-473A-2-J]|uniref:hypothetical protein n=1 Tax=Eudoraea algarum TaxID=3417568 RepID=UPI003D363840